LAEREAMKTSEMEKIMPNWKVLFSMPTRGIDIVEIERKSSTGYKIALSNGYVLDYNVYLTANLTMKVEVAVNGFSYFSIPLETSAMIKLVRSFFGTLNRLEFTRRQTACEEVIKSFTIFIDKEEK
jgi:hypothetical protein